VGVSDLEVGGESVHTLDDHMVSMFQHPSNDATQASPHREQLKYSSQRSVKETEGIPHCQRAAKLRRVPSADGRPVPHL